MDLNEIERKDMPQVESSKLPLVRKTLYDRGIDSDIEYEDITSLKPCQEDYQPDKVSNIVKEIDKSRKIKPVIVSEDNYIMDGHHRWLALKELNKKDINLDRIPIVRIFQPKMECLITLRELTMSLDEMKEVVVYSGRFQPFHKNHYKAYKWLKENFPKADVWIATSNKRQYPESPFTFKEKKYIITEMFDVEKNRVVQISNPYFPKEILDWYDSEKTTFITALGEKDSSRLSHSKYFKNYDLINEKKAYEDQGYYKVVPLRRSLHEGRVIDGTFIRDAFSNQRLSDGKKLRVFKDLYPSFNRDVFELFEDKWDLLNENNIRRFLSEEKDNVKSIISELTTTLTAGGKTGDDVDDGPDTWYTNYSDYERVVPRKAQQAGMIIFDYLVDSNDIDSNAESEWNYDIPDVTFYPAGSRGDEEHDPDPKTGEENPGDNLDKYRDEVEGDPEPTDREKYEKYIQRVSNRAGLAFMKWMGSDESIKDE